MDNRADMQVRCPYCGEITEVHVDIAEDEVDLVEDCGVCCRPMLLHVERDDAGNPTVAVSRESG